MFIKVLEEKNSTHSKFSTTLSKLKYLLQIEFGNFFSQLQSQSLTLFFSKDTCLDPIKLSRKKKKVISKAQHAYVRV